MGIFQSNLDEYFMKRMGALHSNARSRFRDHLIEVQKVADHLFKTEIRPALHHEGIHLTSYRDLEEQDKKRAKSFFKENIFPVLTPLSVDPGHPFPFISNQSLSLGVFLRSKSSGEESFARVKVPTVFPQWIRVDRHQNSKQSRFVSLLSLIRENLQELFPGMSIAHVMPFRVIRDTNIDTDSDAEDLLETVTEELKERKFGEVVRLQTAGTKSMKMVSMLQVELEIDEDQVYYHHGLLDYGSLRAIYEVHRPDLKDRPWSPQPPKAFADADVNIFNVIKAKDILVHHPFESFAGSVEKFIQCAALDPHVIAIKMTLYRTGADSPFIPLLIKAAETGKQVVAVVEIKARFDEEKNIQVAQTLESAGVHVVYGVIGLKTHGKLALVVRREGNKVRSYAHLGTGNYHAVTSRLYTDFGLFTSDPEITDDVVHLFHHLTGKSIKTDYKHLLVAPHTMRSRLLDYIKRETHFAKQGKTAHIIGKMNALDDREIIDALYTASQAGVEIDLVVRGACVLRPGVKGLSENIRVKSIIGRFLEHSRVFYFRNNAKFPQTGNVYIGSADWMTRNLSYRVETLTPIYDTILKSELYEYLMLCIRDTKNSWSIEKDGRSKKTKSQAKDTGIHDHLMNLARSF